MGRRSEEIEATTTTTIYGSVLSRSRWARMDGLAAEAEAHFGIINLEQMDPGTRFSMGRNTTELGHGWGERVRSHSFASTEPDERASADLA